MLLLAIPIRISPADCTRTNSNAIFAPPSVSGRWPKINRATISAAPNAVKANQTGCQP